MKALIVTCSIMALTSIPAFASEEQELELAETISSTDQYDEALIGSVETVVPHDTADDQEDHSDRDRNRRARKYLKKACSAVNLTDDQKSLLKNAMLDYKESAIQLQADLKTAKLRFVRLILDDQADAASADSVVSEGVTAKAAMAQAKGSLATKVFFAILTAEQRAPALKCLVAHKKVMKHRYHRRSHHEHD